MRLTLVMVCLLLSAAAFAQASPSKKGGMSDEERIKALEVERTAALVAHDLKTLERTTPADYTVIGSTGQLLDQKAFLEQVRSGDLRLTADDLDELKVRIYGFTAVLTGRSTLKGTYRGRDISGQDRFMRVYVKRGGAWVPVAYQATRINPAQ